MYFRTNNRGDHRRSAQRYCGRTFRGKHYITQNIDSSLLVAYYENGCIHILQTMRHMSRVGPKVSKSSQPLHPIMATEVFQRWGLDFIGPINPPAKGTKNKYIITATDYTTRWVEARALKDNTATSTAKFIFEEIITKFGCPIELVNDQGSHFLNDTIQILTKTFMVLHRKLTIY